MSNVDYDALRRMMVEVISAYADASREITGRDRFDDRLLQAMAEVPRHEFVPAQLRDYAYADSPLPIGHDKTISQPFIVALMVELLDLTADDVVLEVGTGLGYQAGVMSRLVSQVYSMEIVPELAQSAIERLDRLGYHNIDVRVGNGYYGISARAPFDKIVIAAAPETIPPPLIEQLRPGGRMVVPLGPAGETQQLVSVVKGMDGRIHAENRLPVAFAPMVVAH